MYTLKKFSFVLLTRAKDPDLLFWPDPTFENVHRSGSDWLFSSNQKKTIQIFFKGIANIFSVSVLPHNRLGSDLDPQKYV